MLASERFPAMLPALQSLARACAENSDANLGALNFARCDFCALDPGYHPTAMDLYSIFPPADFQLAERLHEFFSSLGYKPVFRSIRTSAGRSSTRAAGRSSRRLFCASNIPTATRTRCMST